MAGIGFEIRKILKENTLFSLVKAFSYAGVISSGPWIISMISILIVGFFANYYFPNEKISVTFTIIITYIIAFSLIITGFFQLSFTRYVSDLLFKNEKEKVLPNTIGVLIITMIGGSLLISPMALSIYFETNNVIIPIFFEANFAVVSALWIVNVVLTGLKDYKYIVYSFLVSYTTIVVLVNFVGKNGLEYFLFSFFAGQSLLLILLMRMVLKEFKSNKLVSFEFLKHLDKKLIWIGFFYNLALWTDKLVFWYNPSTSSHVVGWLRYSPIYDFPIFLAYLSIAPAMAIFLLRIESEFAIYYDKYFSAAREGGTLKELYLYANDMIESARRGLEEILRIQILTGLFLALFIEQILTSLKIPIVYVPLFIVDLIGTTLQALFMSILTILFYMDKRKEVLILVILAFVLNLSLSITSQILGVYFYGYGASSAYLIVSIIGLFVIDKTFQRVHYETFMLV